MSVDASNGNTHSSDISTIKNGWLWFIPAYTQPNTISQNKDGALNNNLSLRSGGY